MFSGIIDHCGSVVAAIPDRDALCLKITTQFPNFILGESIAVDGVCLTVTACEGATFSCDLSTETLALTHLKNLTVGQTVNLEKALAIGDRLGGHFVTGHVDQVAIVSRIQDQDNYKLMEFSGCSDKYMPYLVPKGSITINGVSLTINSVTEDGFTVMLIPHTLAKTNLAKLNVGSVVNLEYDYLAKTIYQQLSHLMTEQLKRVK